jgi:acyl-CoA synthetase (NDP forming)
MKSQSHLHANLRRLLRPRHVAVVGGARVANVLATLRASWFEGEVWPVSAKVTQVAGYRAFPDVRALPEAPDASFIGIPAEPTIDVVRALADMGAGGAVSYASGFAEAGAEQLQAALVAAAGDLALVGPNCFGIVNAVCGASLWPLRIDTPRIERGVAILAQSGNFGINVEMARRGVPVVYNVSLGNQAQLAMEDFVEVLGADPAIAALGLYVEGLKDIPRFAAAATVARERGIPIVALKIGTSEIGARMAVSHTSSLAGADELYDALFARCGVTRVQTVPAFLETLKAMVAFYGRPCRRVAVFSCSGGDSGMAADCAARSGIALPDLTPSARLRLAQVLPSFAHASNPQDYSNALWGAEEPLREVFAAGLSAEVDLGLLVIDSPTEPVTPEIAATIRALGDAAAAGGKPVAMAPVLPENISPSTRLLAESRGIVVLQGLDDAFGALARSATFGEQRFRASPEMEPPVALRSESWVILDEAAAKAALADSGVPVPNGGVASRAGVGALAARIGGAVAVKALHPACAHKSDLGAVSLNCVGAEAADRAAGAIASRVSALLPGVLIDRFLVEVMVPQPFVELLVGVKRDEQFGYSLLIGGGGVEVELRRDTTLLLLPVTDAEIEAGLRACRAGRLLDGYRGAPRADWRAAISAIQAIIRFVIEADDCLLELDVNPLMVRPDGLGAVAADALIRWAR